MDQHTHDRLVCAACDIGVPLAKNWATTWTLGALGAGVTGAKTKNIGWTILAGLVGLAVGALIDAAARPICGQCAATGAMA